MGDIGSHVDITSRWRGHQAKLGRAVAGSMTAAIVAASLTPEPVDAFLRCDRHHDQSCNRIGPPPAQQRIQEQAIQQNRRHVGAKIGLSGIRSQGPTPNLGSNLTLRSRRKHGQLRLVNSLR